MKACLFLILSLLLTAGAHDPKNDQRILLQLEDEWFHSPAVETRERIYGPDFMHIISDGQILTREEELDYLRKHPLPAQDNNRRRFEDLKVRLYGDVGMVTGRTVILDEKGAIGRTTSFTDVFHWSGQRWQAVNAQETTVARPQMRFRWPATSGFRG